MGKHTPIPPFKGSQYWIQELVNNRSAVFNSEVFRHVNRRKAIFNHTLTPANSILDWVSPRMPNYIEYSGDDMLNELKIGGTLKGYWPTRVRKGAQWDALGSITYTALRGKSRIPANSKIFILVEAKAHVGEMISNCKATKKTSLLTIDKTFNDTQMWLGASSGHDWKKHFYQYANRLAHLYYLRQVRKLNAFLVFLYIVDDPSFPTSKEVWDVAIDLEKTVLGLSKKGLKTFGVLDLFYDAKNGKFI